jgi:hypothetical protein
MRLTIALVALAAALPAPLLAQTAAKPADDPDKVICRREVPIGSLIASRKMCLTKKQWQEREIRGNEEARRQMEENSARNPTPSG